ncbi:hypothetical protein BTVI_01510 [Pitangus sulphuratus]|nr:hypothetical protein BTVI_158941 [Pitangus sulphuratus]KAJ7427938.1 hypothetical protein BTVI_01510 [Pitangus sulphuratus]
MLPNLGLLRFQNGTQNETIQNWEEWLIPQMGCAGIQRELNSQESWAERNIMTLPQVKCKVLHVGTNNPMCQYTPCLTSWKATVQKRGLLVDTKVTMCQHVPLEQGRPATCQATLEQVKRDDPSPLLSTGEMHVGSCAQFWAPQYKRDRDTLERVLQKTMKG